MKRVAVFVLFLRFLGLATTSRAPTPPPETFLYGPLENLNKALADYEETDMPTHVLIERLKVIKYTIPYFCDNVVEPQEKNRLTQVLENLIQDFSRIQNDSNERALPRPIKDLNVAIKRFQDNELSMQDLIDRLIAIQKSISRYPDTAIPRKEKKRLKNLFRDLIGIYSQIQYNLRRYNESNRNDDAHYDDGASTSIDSTKP